jgi:hypothetical protein
MVTIGAMHLMHVKCISVIVTKLHNFLFYTFCVGIFTNMESLPHYGEIQSFLKYVPTERILKISYFRPEQDVNGKVFNTKTARNFILMLIDIKFVQNRVRMQPSCLYL